VPTTLTTATGPLFINELMRRSARIVGVRGKRLGECGPLLEIPQHRVASAVRRAADDELRRWR
jgi:hypothetical protein